jgi:hypothetical protein
MKSDSLLHRLTAAVLLCALSACATTTGYLPGETWQQRDARLKKDAQATVAQGKWLGTLGGSILGTGKGFIRAVWSGVLVKAAGGSDEQAKTAFKERVLPYIVSGAAAGAAWGYKKGALWGENVVKRKEQYAAEEDYLNASLEQTRKRTEAARKMNDQLIGEIASLKKKAADLSKGKNASDEEIQKYEALVKAQGPAIREAQTKIGEALSQAEQERAAATSSAKRDELDKQIAQLQDENRRIRLRIQEFESVPSRIYMAAN